MINSHNDMCGVIVDLQFCARALFQHQTNLFILDSRRARVSPDCVLQNQDFIKRNFQTTLLLKVLGLRLLLPGSTIVSDEERGNRSANLLQISASTSFFFALIRMIIAPDSFVLPNCSLMHKPLFLLKKFKAGKNGRRRSPSVDFGIFRGGVGRFFGGWFQRRPLPPSPGLMEAGVNGN